MKALSKLFLLIPESCYFRVVRYINTILFKISHMFFQIHSRAAAGLPVGEEMSDWHLFKRNHGVFWKRRPPDSARVVFCLRSVESIVRELLLHRSRHFQHLHRIESFLTLTRSSNFQFLFYFSLRENWILFMQLFLVRQNSWGVLAGLTLRSFTWSRPSILSTYLNLVKVFIFERTPQQFVSSFNSVDLRYSRY